MTVESELKGIMTNYDFFINQKRRFIVTYLRRRFLFKVDEKNITLKVTLIQNIVDLRCSKFHKTCVTIYANMTNTS